MRLVKIAFDGGCRGNPGAKYGSFGVKLDGAEILRRERVEFGRGTNNEAEFNALDMALNETLDYFLSQNLNPKQFELRLFTDSTIVKNRLIGKNTRRIWKQGKESSNRMIQHAEKCLKMMVEFGSFDVVWLGREHNVEIFGH